MEEKKKNLKSNSIMSGVSMFLLVCLFVIYVTFVWGDSSLFAILARKICEADTQSGCSVVITLGGFGCPLNFLCPGSCICMWHSKLYLAIIIVALLIFIFAITKMILDFIYTIFFTKEKDV